MKVEIGNILRETGISNQFSKDYYFVRATKYNEMMK